MTTIDFLTNNSSQRENPQAKTAKLKNKSRIWKNRMTIEDIDNTVYFYNIIKRSEIDSRQKNTKTFATCTAVTFGYLILKQLHELLRLKDPNLEPNYNFQTKFDPQKKGKKWKSKYSINQLSN